MVTGPVEDRNGLTGTLNRVVPFLLFAVFCIVPGILSAREFPASALFSIRQLILENGYPQISDKELLNGTCKISGMAGFCRSWESLFANANTLGEERIGRKMVEAVGDPYSMLFSPEETREFTGQLHGEAVGIGITVFPKNGSFIIGGVMADSPAWSKGVISGDELISIDGVKLSRKPLAEALRLLKGVSGSKIVLELRRNNITTVEVLLTRIDLKYKIVDVSIKEGIGIVKISGFGHGVSYEVESAFDLFNKEGIKKCILDLRGNPGGLFLEAIRVASFFLPQGAIICHKDTRNGTTTYVAREMQRWKYDLVVLADGGTASGSELVAKALQDYSRAKILGSTTAGKGSVQTLLPIGDGWFMDLTTAHYRSPLGKDIHKKGIEPDIVLREKDFYLGAPRISKDIDEILGRSLELMKKYKRQDDL